jgi:hypothetical protein
MLNTLPAWLTVGFSEAPELSVKLSTDVADVAHADPEPNF